MGPIQPRAASSPRTCRPAPSLWGGRVRRTSRAMPANSRNERWPRRPRKGRGMSGIVGMVGEARVGGRRADALKRLEYRGYDGAGVATLEDGAIARRRAEGKLGNLASKLGMEPLDGHIGIGHT